MRVQVPPRPQHVARKDLATLAYIVGVALGDGNLSRPNGRATRLRVTCDIKYEQVAQEIEAALRTLLPKNSVARAAKPSRSFDISVYSNKLNDWIPWQVGQGPKTLQKPHIPKWIMINSSYSKACLRGLFQTDGCIYVDRGYDMVYFCNTVEPLIQDVQALLTKMGYKFSTSVVQQRHLPKYTVRVCTRAKQFMEDISLKKH